MERIYTQVTQIKHNFFRGGRSSNENPSEADRTINIEGERTGKRRMQVRGKVRGSFKRV